MLRSMISDTTEPCSILWIDLDDLECIVRIPTEYAGSLDVPHWHLHRGPSLYKSGRTIAESQLLGLNLLTHWDPHSTFSGT